MTIRFMRPLLAVCASLVLSACVATESEPLTDAAKREFSMEGINNPVFDQDSIRFSAVSNGCTTSSDFIVEHVVNNGQCELTVLRAKPDLCRKASSFVDIELTWALPDNCAGMEVVFLNPEAGQLSEGIVRTLSE